MNFIRYCINQPAFSIVPVGQNPIISSKYNSSRKILNVLIRHFSIGIVNVSIKNSYSEILLLDSHLIRQPNQIFTIAIPLMSGDYFFNAWQPYKKATHYFTVE